MDAMVVYHNPVCSKSRGALEILGDKGASVEVIEYLKTKPSRADLERIVDAIPDPPSALVRNDKRFGELDPPERLCWMAAAGADFVGHAQLAYDWRNGNARIGRVAIAPDHRGRGLAKPMLRLIMAQAFADPAIERLELYAIAYNRHAVRIYESVGFVHEGEARAAIRIGGERFGQLTMSMLREEYRQAAAVK